MRAPTGAPALGWAMPPGGAPSPSGPAGGGTGERVVASGWAAEPAAAISQLTPPGRAATVPGSARGAAAALRISRSRARARASMRNRISTSTIAPNADSRVVMMSITICMSTAPWTMVMASPSERAPPAEAIRRFTHNPARKLKMALPTSPTQATRIMKKPPALGSSR